MTTPASATPKSFPTRRAPPRPGSSPAPRPTSPATALIGSNASSPTTRSPTAGPQRSTRPCAISARSSGSSSPTAPGPMAKPNASTAPCKPNGPTGNPSAAVPTVKPHLRPGSSTTTLNESTPASEQHLSTECHQPNGSVQLGGGAGPLPCHRVLPCSEQHVHGQHQQRQPD